MKTLMYTQLQGDPWDDTISISMKITGWYLISINLPMKTLYIMENTTLITGSPLKCWWSKTQYIAGWSTEMTPLHSHAAYIKSSIQNKGIVEVSSFYSPLQPGGEGTLKSGKVSLQWMRQETFQQVTQSPILPASIGSHEARCPPFICHGVYRYACSKHKLKELTINCLCCGWRGNVSNPTPSSEH